MTETPTPDQTPLVPAEVSPVDTGLRRELDEIRAALVAADPKADLPGHALVPSVDIVRHLAAERDAYFANWEKARAELASRSTPALPDGAADRRLNQAVPLIGDLLDDEDCSLDHHGYCQTHYWFSDSDCPQARAKRWLAELDKPSSPATDPTPDLDLADYCAALSWTVRHTPPGTTDREDTDTPIAAGWWLLGLGEDPDVPVVQVHLGETLPVATEPEPATPDGPSAEWRAGWAAACRALDRFAAERMDAADDRDDKPVTDAYGAMTVRAQHWMYNPERAPVAPQAPAEPTEDVAAIRAQQIAALTSGATPRVDCAVSTTLTPGQIRRLLQEARNLKDEGHHAGETIELLLDPKLGGLLDDITEVGHLIPRGPAGPAVPEDTATRPWREGDVACDRTGFVHVRYAQGWRTWPRTTGTQYGDDVMEAHLGPLVRLDAVPPGTSDVGALPRDFVHRAPEVDDYNDDLIPARPECTVAGCTHPQWRDLDVCQFHVPLKGNVEVRSHRADTTRPADSPSTSTPKEA
jgi:hypothetical protein